jgi:hypothetical protein
MKLNKKQQRRVQSYLDMLEYNSDVISNYYGSERIELIQNLNGILNERRSYIKTDKKMLNKMEKLYHKFHKDNVEIYNPK